MPHSAPVSVGSPRLENFHVTFLAVVMGMAGFSLAVHKAAEHLPALHWVGSLLFLLTVVLFLGVVGLYAVKWIRYPAAVRHEINHPVKINFFPLLPMTLLLISVSLVERSPVLAPYVWSLGAALQLLASLFVVSAWISRERFTIEHLTPAWFIPVVGLILVPMAGTRLGYYEISWFFFSVGLLFWLILMAIVFYRMFFHAPIPARLLPTLFMLFAPPAAGFIAYTRLNGGVLDGFGRILYYFALFLFLLVLAQLPRLLKIPFFLSWWASSFPLAAKTLATFVFAALIQSTALQVLGWVQLALLTGVILFLLVRTTVAIRRAELCVED